MKRILLAFAAALLLLTGCGPKKAQFTFDGSKAYVFIASGDKAVKREVKTGENFGNKVEIISGIKAGDKLITDGNKNIADGTFIRIINQE